MKAEDPRVTYEAIAAAFGISASCAWYVINRTFETDAQPGKVRMVLPPAAVKPPESIITPFDPKRAMVGRASVVRSYRAA